MDKILELLGADKLDESTQADLKEKLQAVIEVKAKELSQASLDEQKQQLVEKYEKMFEDYKDKLTTDLSNFVDNILEKQMVIPEEVLEFAKKGQLYHDLIEQFKVRLGVDQGLLDEEVKSLLREAKEEIKNLRESNDQKIAEALELKQDAQELAAQVYLYKKCEGLTESQRKHVFSILADETDRDEIDRKFDVIKDSERFDPVKIGNEKDPEGTAEKIKKKNKKTSDPGNNEDQVEEGEGVAEVQDDEDGEDVNEEDNVNEEDDPFTEFRNEYLKVLKENKIT